MKTTKLRSVAVVGLLWLTLGAGCSKDPPEPKSCNDGTCCMKDTRAYDFVETIENRPADLSGRFLVFQSGLPSKAVKEEFKAYWIGVCNLGLSKIAGLRNTVPADMTSWPNFPFQYRVWGKVYGDRDARTLFASPILYVYIDRIEEAK